MNQPIKTLFPYFGGKRKVAEDVWRRLGAPKQYLEPFAGSLAMLMAKPEAASLEVVGDFNGFIANFWRAAKHQPDQVAYWADYPVSHIDMGARHIALMHMRDDIGAALHDPEWPGDAKAAGWWLWGQCCWIGSGWCDWSGRIPHVSDAGRGVQASGRIPHVSDAGQGVQASGQIPHVSNAGLMTSGGRAAYKWLHKVADRLERVRVIHGDWSRCLNHHYGGKNTAVFLDPPYKKYAAIYAKTGAACVATDVEAWAAKHPHLRIALCGHVGDYDLPEWDAVQWSRGSFTYGGSGTKDVECIWYSPACHHVEKDQVDMFGDASA